MENKIIIKMDKETEEQLRNLPEGTVIPFKSGRGHFKIIEGQITMFISKAVECKTNVCITENGGN